MKFLSTLDNADKILDGTTNKAYTSTEKTKLAGIAEAADKAIVGSGSSGTDFWVKYADGTLIKYGNFDYTGACSTALCGQFKSADLTYTWRTDAGFPAFSSTILPHVSLSAYNTSSSGYFSWFMSNVYSATAFKYGIWTAISASSRTWTIQYYAIGRWN
jgi:hypothetical protein